MRKIKVLGAKKIKFCQNKFFEDFVVFKFALFWRMFSVLLGGGGAYIIVLFYDNLITIMLGTLTC